MLDYAKMIQEVVMLSDREKNLVKIGYLAGFEKAWYIASADEKYLIDSEIYKLCTNWLNEPVDLAGMFTVEMEVSTEADCNDVFTETKD